LLLQFRLAPLDREGETVEPLGCRPCVQRFDAHARLGQFDHRIGAAHEPADAGVAGRGDGEIVEASFDPGAQGQEVHLGRPRQR